MCDSADQPAIGRHSKRSNNVCHKCLAAKPTLKIRHTYYCQSCFLKAFVTKVRVALGKVLRVPPPAKPRVLVAISGGHASRKVDYLNTEKKKFETLVACHIDEGLLFPEIQSNAGTIKQWVMDCGITYEGISLEDVFKREVMEEARPLPWLCTSPTSDPVESVYKAVFAHAPTLTPQALLQQYLASATKLSTREDLLWHLKQTLLHQMARKHRCEFIVVGDTCTRLAVKAIAMTSKGRGYSLPFDLGSGAEWFQDVQFVRPFRDCMDREVVLYNRFQGLEAVHTPSSTTGLPVKSSIDRLTEDFIKGLDRDFPSTTSTVVRTAAKLKPSQEAAQQPACLLCRIV
ncbi:Cytoplasmic tRNA 2-thiolation protein 2 [Dimargaris verticillata]|uniref:Cytoplasmic tRNA 2-thiolation protein 2 n=1 Tax=Dimargaris verticillata TaxID=2761393 RepID=A0A9W8BAM5_9FUNG|nr:Cytoplasmic tRNA 2-thiolation protein 2 [Dimargaris verticillata]